MRKNFFRTLLCMLLIGSMLTVPGFAEGATVSGSEVNVRSGPGLNYPVVDCLPRSAAVTVTDCSNSDWYAIRYEGGSGFMSSRYLRMDQQTAPAPGAGDSSQGQTGYINAMYVRFRSGPGTDSSILGSFNTGKEIQILDRNGEWVCCRINGQTGYVYGGYVSSQRPVGGNTASSSGSGVIIIGGESEEEEAPPSVNNDIIIQTRPEEESTAQPEPTPVPSPEVSETEGKQGVINAMYVRFRSGPGTGYSILGTYNQGAALTATGTSGEWTRCIIDGQEGFVFTQYVSLYGNAAMPELPQPEQEQPEQGQPEQEQPEQPEEAPEESPAPDVESTQAHPGYINGNNVRMRSEPSTSSRILDELFFGNNVTITGYSGDWTAITCNGQSGYVFSRYVMEGEYSYSSSGGTASGREIADFALQYVGYNYCWGGKDPSTGFDCSGLMYYVYSQFGYTLNRIACDQARNGVHVEPSDLQPGDLLCFYSSGSYIGHVGMYIGDNQFVHASNSTTGVIISELSGYYATRGYEARRII